MHPADDQDRTLPAWSLMLMTVLLNDACTLQMANGTFFLSFLRPGAFLVATAPSAPTGGAVSFAGAGAPASFASVFLGALGAFSCFGAASFPAASFGSFASAMDLLGPLPYLIPSCRP